MEAKKLETTLNLNPKFEVVYKGKMFEVVTWEGKPGVMFEAAVRAPGTRLLIETIKNGHKALLMTKEIRREAGGVDFRLPGGKVFNSLDDLNKFKERGGDIMPSAQKAAKVEGREEAGVQGGDYSFIEMSKAGASVEWDLYYFLVKDAVLGEQELEEHEMGDIETVILLPEEIFEKLKNREIKEGRSADMLWWWLAKNDFVILKE